MKFIDSKTHGVIDYLTGILLLASPWLFGFTDTNVAMWIAIIVGLMIISMSLLTNYELGAVHAIPLDTHLTTDIIVGVLLLASPWIFGFAEQVKWPHVIIGILEIGAGMFTRKSRYVPVR